MQREQGEQREQREQGEQRSKTEEEFCEEKVQEFFDDLVETIEEEDVVYCPNYEKINYDKIFKTAYKLVGNCEDFELIEKLCERDEGIRSQKEVYKFESDFIVATIELNEIVSDDDFDDAETISFEKTDSSGVIFIQKSKDNLKQILLFEIENKD